MTGQKRPRAIWAISAVLGGVVVLATVLLLVGLRAYWVAKYRGRRANLAGALLLHSYLPAVRLVGTDLTGAKLTGANLVVTNFSSANLTRADLTGACLMGADLRTAKLAGTIFTHALYDQTTRWPTGFDPAE